MLRYRILIGLVAALPLLGWAASEEAGHMPADSTPNVNVTQLPDTAKQEGPVWVVNSSSQPQGPVWVVQKPVEGGATRQG